MGGEPGVDQVKVSHGLSLVPRGSWEAADATHTPTELSHPVMHVWYIYDIGTPMCRDKEGCRRIVKKLQERCMTAMGLSDIPFNFLIGGDGRVYEGRGWLYKPPAFKKFPDEGCERIDIGFISNQDKTRVTHLMVRAAADLVKAGIGDNYIHEQFNTKEWSRIGEPIEDDPNKPFG